jgi:serine/threonine-protein kinase HipA
MGFSRDTKYESSMEQLIPILDKHCTFPLLEKRKLFRLTIFNFLVGNEDAHLKNFSLIRREGKVELSPVYDLVNSTIVVRTQEELALPLKGKKNRLNYVDLFDYFGKERLGLSEQILVEEVQIFKNAFSDLDNLLAESFLSKGQQDRYFEVVNQRRLRIAL